MERSRRGGEADPGEVAAVLADVARLGPYFVIDTGPDNGAGWRVLAETAPGHLGELVDVYAERLATDERRVAASILFQGLASRLWSPVVAAAARGIVPDLSGLLWAHGAPTALRLPEPRGWRVEGPVDGAALVHGTVVAGQLVPLSVTLRALVRLPDGLIWGNAASALAGGLAVGPRDAVREALVRALLDRAPLTGTGGLGPAGFVRRSCCLYYRVPPGGEMCGDCALLPKG
ncbi:(2Fe-2S)-binding protein [Spirillospora albida]|uniref:(2Fe-2S)-binding protein n=1 Tax=Spirillospora albida TaxID=58123 RepID=UPI000560AF42|nr:(2Fe-2S)-binding protein [Spirillospora albida]